MTQPGLFDEQPRNLERVSKRIGSSILAFCRARVGREFRADELRRHVEAECGPTAPGSADRIMRELRARGAIAYSVLSRRESRYRVDGA